VQFLDVTVDAIQKWRQKITSCLILWGEIDIFGKIYATMGLIRTQTRLPDGGQVFADIRRYLLRYLKSL